MFRLTTGPKSVGLHSAYDVAHQLGKGSFAAVHSAVHRASGVIYAIKIIKLDLCKMTGTSEELADDGTQKNPFQREIDVMETLNHINICKMKEVFVEPQILGLYTLTHLGMLFWN
jgi:serine/threonine/tyrosine protein kinase RAD53